MVSNLTNHGKMRILGLFPFTLQEYFGIYFSFESLSVSVPKKQTKEESQNGKTYKRNVSNISDIG